MHNYRANGEFEKRQWISNSTILEEYVDYNTYNVWIPVASLVEVSGTIAALSMRDACPVRIFPDGVDYTVTYAFRKPATWVSGVVSGKVFYTGPGKPTTDFVIGIGIKACERGDTIPTLATYQVTHIAPSTDGEVIICDDWYISNEDIARCKVDANDVVIFVAFNRDGADADDTNNTDLELIGIELYYIENPHSTTSISSRTKIETRSTGTIKET